MMLWNHFYYWGTIFMDYQNFAGLLGRNSMGNWFVALQYKKFITGSLSYVGAD